MAAAQQQQPAKPVPLPAKLAVGAVAGVLGTSFIYPIDIVKTRLQHQTPGPKGELMYRGPFHAFRTILAREGVRGLYRGLGANLVGVTPEKAIKLAANDFLREALAEADGSVRMHNQLLAGAGAGFFQVIATNPMEITKIRMQTQNLKPVAERMTTGQVVRSLGIRGMYRSTHVTLLRDVPYSLVFFPLNATLAQAAAGENGITGIPALIGSGAVAGATAAWICTPADCIKTKLQAEGAATRYKGVVDCFQQTVKQGGVSSLWKGAGPRMAVTAPLFGIALMFFELQKRYLSGQPLF